ncbi:MAG: hypothetical protein K0Q55_921, partial [Verrucomicrobia bacterium]|nr:hypothetical protein [Verrucomicrobiota bacterium]
MCLPLPKGEGRGEGEGRVNKSLHVQNITLADSARSFGARMITLPD